MPIKRYEKLLLEIDKEGRLRHIPAVPEGDVVDLVSNDYLGLARRSDDFMEEFRERWPSAPMTSSGSRLLTVRQKEYADFENLLETLYGHGRKALLYNSGYHANTGSLSALACKGTLIVADKLIHASLIDGIKLSGADFYRFRHNDVASLKKILSSRHHEYERIIVVTESVFSMDGDVAPLKEIAELKKEFPNMLLYLDEAHAIATFGPRGLGLTEELGLMDDVDILIGTLGKGVASEGAFVITHPILKQWLVNSSRSFIFSTVLAPASAAWSQLMVEKMVTMQEQRLHLRKISKLMVKILNEGGLRVSSESHIIPVIVGDSSSAVKISSRLREAGILAMPIRKPTVPEGTARLRISLNSSIKADDIPVIANKILKAVENEIPLHKS